MSVSVAETTAALTVIATLTNDELMATRIRRELAGRRHPLPADVAELDRVTISRTVRMDAGVGSVGVRRTPADADLLLELSGPGVRPMTLILHVDHRYGSLVKDAIPCSRGRQQHDHETERDCRPGRYNPGIAEMSPPMRGRASRGRSRHTRLSTTDCRPRISGRSRDPSRLPSRA